MRRMTRRPASLVACLALAAGLLGLNGPAALAGRAAPAAAGRWHVVARIAHGFFDAVTAPGRFDAWAFGGQQSGSASFAVARHWNGHHWSEARRIAGGKNSGVVCAGASSASNVLAFMERSSGPPNPPRHASALRQRNGRWATTHAWSDGLGTFITGCNVLGEADVWAFGGEIFGVGRGIGTWHLTRSGWRQLDTGNLVLFSASAVSARDLWAAGADVSPEVDQPVLGRWTGTKWTENRSISGVLPTSASALTVISAVNARSDRDVWVEATMISNRGRTTGVVVAHWNGTKWSRVKRGSKGYYLPAAVPDGHGGWWSAPYQTAFRAVTRYLLHEARGRWTRYPLPGPVLASSLHLVHVPQSQAMLATGFYRGSGTLLAFGTLPS